MTFMRFSSLFTNFFYNLYNSLFGEGGGARGGDDPPDRMTVYEGDGRYGSGDNLSDGGN